jgi:hypothetical protein
LLIVTRPVAPANWLALLRNAEIKFADHGSGSGCSGSTMTLDPSTRLRISAQVALPIKTGFEAGALSLWT